jgi:hypothetical protein
MNIRRCKGGCLDDHSNITKKNQGEEILPEDGWRKEIEDLGMTLSSLKDWYREDAPRNPSLTASDARARVNELRKYANITSSDTDEAVIRCAIERRL